MEASKLQSWKISIHVKSKSLHFRVNASNILPHWGKGGEKISLFLRLFRFFSLKVESENLNRLGKTKRKSKLLRLLAKLVPRPRELTRSKLATEKRSQVRSLRNGSPQANGCHHLCQAILSRISLIIEKRWMILLIILVLLPFFFCKLGGPKYLDELGIYISSVYSLVKGICNILVPYIATGPFHM